MRALIIAASEPLRKRSMAPPPFGTLALGYYGEVAGADFITPAQLRTAANIVTGFAQNDDSTWLKFSKDGKPLYVSKKAIQRNVTYEHLNALGAIKGTKIVTIGGKQYKLRVLKGAAGDPSSTPGGEWNDLIHRVHSGAGGERWANFTDADLALGLVDGGVNICQEAYSGAAGWVCRGYPNTVSGLWYIQPNTPNNYYGWRPVLEPI